MSKKDSRLNSAVTKFLDELDHPLRMEIDQIRRIILESANGLTENIKWNGPNYCFDNEDRVTMRIQPPKQVQLIFHRGVKKLSQTKSKLIDDKSGLLDWKGNDRAVATFRNAAEIETSKMDLADIVVRWIKATK